MKRHRLLFPAFCILAMFLAAACHKTTVERPSGEDIEPEPEPEVTVPARDMELFFTATMPNLRLSDGKTSVLAYWSGNPIFRVITNAGTYLLQGTTGAGGRTASFSGTVQTKGSSDSFSGWYPGAGTPSVGSVQTPAPKSCDPKYDCLLMQEMKAETGEADSYELRMPAFKRPLAYLGLKPGSTFEAWSEDVVKNVQFSLDPSSSDLLAGSFSFSGGELIPAANSAGIRALTLDYRESGATLGNCEIWAVVFGGIHSFSTIVINTDKRSITLNGRTLSAMAGYGNLTELQITPSDKVTDYDPGTTEDDKAIWCNTSCSLSGPAKPDNFLCLVNGHAYSPYTLRYLDPFTLNTSNPNGWSVSNSCKLEGSSPVLSDEQYRSVMPYIMFYPATNTIYGPASKNNVMQAYSYDSMLYVNQFGTPALMFRRLGASGAAPEENTVAQWVISGTIEDIVTASNGNVSVKNGSLTITRDFKVDKTSAQYSTSSTNRDSWKAEDVIMIQQLGRYGNASSGKEYLKSGFCYIRQIQSDSYDPVSGAFRTMDHYSTLIVDCYWEK